jgi:hypothetical protein
MSVNFCKCGHRVEVDELFNGATKFFDGLHEVTPETPTITYCPSCGRNLALTHLLTADEHLERIVRTAPTSAALTNSMVQHAMRAAR